jgi:DNA-binding CsgD family transcriptional regulator
MMARAIPNHAELLAVMRLLADVAALKADANAQRRVLVDGLNELLDTDCGFFYAADCWRPNKGARFVQTTITTQADPAAFTYFSHFGTRYPLEADPFCYFSIRDERPEGRWTLRELLPDREACRKFHDIMDLVGATRWRDGVVSHFRIPDQPDRVVGFALHRLGERRTLDAREKALARFAVEELRRLYQRGHFSLPPVPPRDLPPRLRQILDRVLAGHSPKSIARGLDLSLWTVREHLQRLYRHYGVSGREQLMARFTISGEPSRPGE